MEADIAGYIIHYGISSKQCEVVVDGGNVTGYVLANLPEEVKYFIALTTCAIKGNESHYSKDITTHNCYIGITYTTLPPFVYYIFPCIDYTSYPTYFSLLRNDFTVRDQTEEYT